MNNELTPDTPLSGGRIATSSGQVNGDAGQNFDDDVLSAMAKALKTGR